MQPINKRSFSGTISKIITIPSIHIRDGKISIDIREWLDGRKTERLGIQRFPGTKFLLSQSLAVRR